jgi:hypothetical protein
MKIRFHPICCLLFAACGPLEDGTVPLDSVPAPKPALPTTAALPTTPPLPATITVPTVALETNSVCPSVTREGAAPLLAVGHERSAHIVRADGSTLELELNLPNLNSMRVRTHSYAGKRHVLVNTQFWYINQTFEHRSVLTLFTAEGQPLWTDTMELVQDVKIGDDGHVAYTVGGELAITSPSGATKTQDNTWMVGRPTDGWLPTRRYLAGDEWQWGWMNIETLSFSPFHTSDHINKSAVIAHGRILISVEEDENGPVLLTRAAGAERSAVHRLSGLAAPALIRDAHPTGWLLLASGEKMSRVQVLANGDVRMSDLDADRPAGLRSFDGCLQSNFSIDRQGRVMVPLRNDDLAFMYLNDPNTQQWQRVDDGFWDAQGVQTTATDGVFMSRIHTTQSTFCRGTNWTTKPQEGVVRDDHTRLNYVRDGVWHTLVAPDGRFIASPTGQCVITQTVDNINQETTLTLRDLLSDPSSHVLSVRGNVSWFSQP